MYQRGIIKDIDPNKARARVILPAADQIVSWWLDILQIKAFGDKHIWLPDIGAEVACLIDENGESGCILGGVYTAKVAPPTDNPNRHETLYSDGTRIRYDRNAHHLEVELTDGGTMMVSGACVTVNADVVIQGDAEISGNVKIGGTLEATGAASFGSTGNFMGPLSAPAISWSGGGVSASSGMSLSGPMEISGALTVAGTVAGGDVEANGISLTAHTHTSADPGKPTSGPA